MSPILKEFRTTDIGLMSIAVVAVTIGIISNIGYMFASNPSRR
ncbi:MAG: DUF3149 domain-containing protein [Gammaproteobacteria bacterium]